MRNTQGQKKTQIVVVGGGAGGLELVARLGKTFGRKQFDIILVERNRAHIWKPLLHEVAAGSLDANLDEVGYRSHAYRWGYRYFFGSLEDIDRDAREVIIAPVLDEDGSEIIGRHRIRYDYLVMAIGSVSNDFGTPGVREHCIFLDNRAQADRFRQKLLNHCLRVSRNMTADPGADDHVEVVIVGGGATGVELAAELYNAAAALGHYGLEVFDESRLKIILIEAGERILPALPEKLAQAAHEELESLGVRVVTGVQVVEATDAGVKTEPASSSPPISRSGPRACGAPSFCGISEALKPTAPVSSSSGRRSRPPGTTGSSPSATAVHAPLTMRAGPCRRAPKPRTRWPARCSRTPSVRLPGSP